ncbi:hypothetical protein L210DRAFT_3511088, partial [Boletus edulis BED1]
MSPHSWATPEQETFLLEFYNNFIQCQAKHDYGNFWPAFFERWFQKFPERAALFPDIPVSTQLTEEQKKKLGNAINARKDQLRNKLRNKWGASKKGRQAKDVDSKSISVFISELMEMKETRTRKPQRIKVYLNLYYDEKIKPLIEGGADVQKNVALAAASDEAAETAKLSPKLATIMGKAREMFKAETPEVKARVEAWWNELVAAGGKGPSMSKVGSQSPQYYIDRLAPTFAQFLGGLQELMGWSFTVLMGGPTPEAGGKIEACSIHVGKTQIGNTFDRACPNFTGTIMQPYKSFLENAVDTKTDIGMDVGSSGEGNTSKGNAGEDNSDMGNTMAQATLAAEVNILPHAPEIAETPMPTDPYPCPDTDGHDTLPPLQMTSLDDTIMKETWTDLELPTPTAISNDDFCYDFGNQVAIPELDDFLAEYSAD